MEWEAAAEARFQRILQHAKQQHSGITNHSEKIIDNIEFNGVTFT